MSRWANIKGKSVVGATEYIDRRTGSNFDYKHGKRGSILMSAYMHLNISIRKFVSDTPYKGEAQGVHQVSFDVLHKKIDISFFPIVCTEPFRVLTDTGAFAHMGKMVFYTAKGKRSPPNTPVHFLTIQGFVYITTLILMILTIYFLQGRLMNSPTAISSMSLYMCAILFASDTKHPPSSQRTVTRLLLYFWSVGAFFLSSYIESELTSEACVPSVSQSIDTVDELERELKLKNIRPCVVRNLFVHQYIWRSKTGVLADMKDVLKECDDCLEILGNAPCRKKVQNRTHTMVLVEPTGTSDLTKLLEWHQGSEYFAIFPIVFIASKAFPFLREHHEIAATLLETGLYLAAQNKPDSTAPVESLHEESEMSLVQIMFLYSCGCLIASVAFLLERSSIKKEMCCSLPFKGRRQTRRRIKIPTRSLLFRTSSEIL